MRLIAWPAILVVALVAAAPRPADARQAPSPVFRGLFGGAEPIGNRDHALDLIVTGFAAHVRTLETVQTDLPGESTLQGGNVSLIYSRNWRQASAGFFGNAGTAYVSQRDALGLDPWITRWNVGGRAGFSREISRRTTLAADGYVAYSPDYRLGLDFSGQSGFGGGLFGGGGLSPGRLERIPGLDDAVADMPSVYALGDVRLTRRLSRRGSLEGYYIARHVNFLENEPLFGDRMDHMIGGRYRHAVARYVSVRAGYAYRRSDFTRAEQDDFTSHDIDVGVDGGYGREFQIARRTTFEFDTRSSLFVYDRLTDDDTFDPTTRFFLGGQAALVHRWARTWQAEARYDRSVSFIDGFADPFFSNRATAIVRGLLSRRLDFIGHATHTIGDVGYTGADRGYYSTIATAQVRLALFRNLAAHAQYFYYRHAFEGGVDLPILVQRRFERHGGSVGVTLWLPLL